MTFEEPKNCDESDKEEKNQAELGMFTAIKIAKWMAKAHGGIHVE